GWGWSASPRTGWCGSTSSGSTRSLPPRDSLGQLAGAPRVERLQAIEHATGVVEPAQLHVGLAQVLERVRIVGPQPQRLVVGSERLGILALVAQRVAEAVPRLRIGGLHLQGPLEGGRRHAPFLRAGGRDPA